MVLAYNLRGCPYMYVDIYTKYILLDNGALVLRYDPKEAIRRGCLRTAKATRRRDLQETTRHVHP